MFVSSATFARIYPALYLAVHVVLWATALPAYFAAIDGITEDGTHDGLLREGGRYAAFWGLSAAGGQ